MSKELLERRRSQEERDCRICQTRGMVMRVAMFVEFGVSDLDIAKRIREKRRTIRRHLQHVDREAS
jgi:hypothetical protein